MKIAIIHLGAPAGGMNAATRAAATYCLSRGHRPFSIGNGFPGLCRHDSYRFDGLLIIGGFEAFHALSELQKARESYPAFRIPMVCLPATISNNVPGTEYSLGSDTCLNALIDYCDAIKQSASASRRRVFVVEVQGGRSGYVATMAGLSVGALAVYTPEEGINLKMLESDIDHLKRALQMIRKREIFQDLYHRTHCQHDPRRSQGPLRISYVCTRTRPTRRHPHPMDRVRAVRLAIRCVQFLEDNVRTPKEILADPSTASVIGIKGAAVIFSPIPTLEKEDTDWKDRRPKSAFWLELTDIADTLSGRKGIPGSSTLTANL
ncbi:phosphofructokinase domain-containing protein [Tirmania nivea]|nr:phosphofructokinase domain-containing protein [Tirmania nivea]